MFSDCSWQWHTTILCVDKESTYMTRMLTSSNVLGFFCISSPLKHCCQSHTQYMGHYFRVSCHKHFKKWTNQPNHTGIVHQKKKIVSYFTHHVVLDL